MLDWVKSNKRQSYSLDLVWNALGYNVTARQLELKWGQPGLDHTILASRKPYGNHFAGILAVVIKFEPKC